MQNKSLPELAQSVDSSAYVVNLFRARFPQVSLDSYAHHWVTPATETLADLYLDLVGESETVVHCLRHSFFLRNLRAFINEHPQGVCINIGSGFTNYPYLMDNSISFCEVDKPCVINSKRLKLQELEQNQLLPHREVKYFTVDDLNDTEDLINLLEQLNVWVDSRPSIVMLEGVFYWIASATISLLFKLLENFQNSGSLVITTSFQPQEEEKKMFKELAYFSKIHFGMKDFVPTTLSNSFYRTLDSYELVSHDNYLQMSKLCEHIDTFEHRSQVLEEDCYVLRRI